MELEENEEVYLEPTQAQVTERSTKSAAVKIEIEEKALKPAVRVEANRKTEKFKRMSTKKRLSPKRAKPFAKQQTTTDAPLGIDRDGTLNIAE